MSEKCMSTCPTLLNFYGQVHEVSVTDGALLAAARDFVAKMVTSSACQGAETMTDEGEMFLGCPDRRADTIADFKYFVLEQEKAQLDP